MPEDDKFVDFASRREAGAAKTTNWSDRSAVGKSKMLELTSKTNPYLTAIYKNTPIGRFFVSLSKRRDNRNSYEEVKVLKKLPKGSWVILVIPTGFEPVLQP